MIYKQDLIFLQQQSSALLLVKKNVYRKEDFQRNELYEVKNVEQKGREDDKVMMGEDSCKKLWAEKMLLM